MLPLARSLGQFKFTPSTCGNNALNSMLQQMISQSSIEPCRITDSQTQAESLLIDSWLLTRPGYPVRNDRSSFSRERSDGDCVFGQFNGYKPGDVLSSHRASELTGQSPLPLQTPVSCLQRLIDQSCFPSSSRFAPSSFRLRLPVCDRFREPHDLT